MYKIYEIRCNETDEVYIGKTIRTLEHRLCAHKKLDCSSKQIIERGNYVMSKIDDCDTEEESIFFESYYIRNTDNCINIVVPDRTPKEYYEAHKDELIVKNKIWKEENKDELIVKNKEYYEAHKDEIRVKSKIWKEAHKDEIRVKNKEYREAHKDEIRVKNKEKYTCECGSIIIINSKSRHEKSQKHINFINSK